MILGQILFELRATKIDNLYSFSTTLTKHNQSTSETPGAQLHILINTSVNFVDSTTSSFMAT
jgi:hypothetical protein